MKTDPFVHYQTELDYYVPKITNTCFPPVLLDKNNLYLYPTLPFIRHVEYSSDEGRVIQSLGVEAYRNKDGTYNLNANLNDLGLYKRIEWKPQREVRYQFCVLPHTSDGKLKLNVEYNHEELPFEHMDLSLSEEGFNSLEVTLGPKMKIEDQNKVISLMHKFFKNDADKRIRNSVLIIK